jgi:hypothetical protein
MFSLAVWKLDWWNEQFTEISFWAAVWGLATPGYTVADTAFWIFVISLDDETIRNFLRSKIAPSLGKAAEAVVKAAKG